MVATIPTVCFLKLQKLQLKAIYQAYALTEMSLLVRMFLKNQYDVGCQATLTSVYFVEENVLNKNFICNIALQKLWGLQVKRKYIVIKYSAKCHLSCVCRKLVSRDSFIICNIVIKRFQCLSFLLALCLNL